MLPLRLLCAAAVVAAAARPAARPALGVELSLRPAAAGVCDVLPQSLGGFLAPNGSAAAADASGWPLQDAYIVVFDEAAPAPAPASLYGAYALTWRGNASVALGPGTEAALSGATFDAAAWAGAATVTLTRSGGARLPALALVFADTVRAPGAALGTGVFDVRLRAPGCAPPPPPPAAQPLWHPSLLRALTAAPFAQVRMMEWFGTNTFRNFSRPDRGVLEWASRTQLSDAVWGGYGAARDGALGAPWETAVLLAQALPSVDVWLNVPVYASDDYVAQLAALLHRGAPGTGGAGLPAGTRLWLELGNELWLNGTDGGPGSNYLWNLAAAEDEVGRNPASPLAAGGATDPQVWASRRHVRELLRVAAAFESEWGSASLRSTVMPVLGRHAPYAAIAAADLAWARTELGLDPAQLLAAIAVNCYYIAGFVAGTPAADMPAAWMAASDAEVPARQRMAAVAAAYNLSLVAYESAPVGIALGEGEAGGPTTDTIISVQRSAAMAPVLAHDLANWLAAGGAQYNHYALASAYGAPPRYQWGLLEDLANLTAAKYVAVQQELG